MKLKKKKEKKKTNKVLIRMYTPILDKVYKNICITTLFSRVKLLQSKTDRDNKLNKF